MRRNADQAHRRTDQELAALEKRIAAEYKKAADELQEKVDAYFASFEQQVGRNEPFIVGGEELMYPGDPRGSGWNIYNCRCTMIAEVEGVDTSDAPRRARDPETGESIVIENMTYAQWEAFKRGAEEVQISPYRNQEVQAWQKSLQNKENLAILNAKIAAGELSTTVSRQQQEKHIEGSPQFERYLADRIGKGQQPQSILKISLEEAQKIIDQYSGTGIVAVTRKGEMRTVEYVTTNKIIGSYFENDSFVETRRVAIHYGKRSAHIVPVKEKLHD